MLLCVPGRYSCRCARLRNTGGLLRTEQEQERPRRLAHAAAARGHLHHQRFVLAEGYGGAARYAQGVCMAGVARAGEQFVETYFVPHAYDTVP